MVAQEEQDNVKTKKLRKATIKRYEERLSSLDMY